MARSHQDTLESRMQGKLARPVWGWGPGETPGPTPLFVANVPSGERAARLMTIVSSAKRHSLDVWKYLKDVLDRLLAGETDYSKLLPDIWKHEHPEAIRTYREEESRHQSDRKRITRARRIVAAKLKRQKT